MSQRTDRLDSQIRAELAELLHREMKDPRVGFATITRVETARDLGTAKVWVSIMGTEAEREQTMKALTDATPWLRRQLGGRLTLRHVPQLVIRRDDSIEAGDRVLRLLRELEDEGAFVSREAVVEAIRNASRITAICHENPDADTLGSALALRIAAERLGKQAEVVAADPVPPSLVDLPGACEVRTTPRLEPDVAVVLDGPLARTGAVVTDAAEWLHARPDRQHRPSRLERRRGRESPPGSTPMRPPPARWSPC